MERVVDEMMNYDDLVGGLEHVCICLFFHRLGFWLVVWNSFSHILGIIIPIDFHIFQRGRAIHHQPGLLGIILPMIWQDVEKPFGNLMS